MQRSKGSLKTCSLLATLFSAMVFAAPAMAAGPLEVLLEDFEDGSTAGAVAVDPGNSSALGASNSAVSNVSDQASLRLRISDPDGLHNGAVLTLPGALPGPGYYLITADIKVNNANAPIGSFGMGAVIGAPTTARISDENAGYVMNLTSLGDASLGYQTVGAAVRAPVGPSYPQDLTLYFSTDVSGNSFNGPSFDGNHNGAHRSGATAFADANDAVFVDNITRFGPGNFGEERHLWISVGDVFTNLATLESQLVAAKANNFNCVDILARYRADAYYVPNRTDATYPNPEPFGTRVGTTPASPTNDPLQYAIDRGHELGLKVYISFSSFLVTPNGTYPGTLPADSIMWFYNSGSPRPMVSADAGNEGLWADIGRADVRAYTKNILMDIVSNYDIDGVVFDRIRYPGQNFSYNPVSLAELGYSSNPLPNDAGFREARRNVIADFLQDCYNSVTSAKPWVVISSTPVCTLDNMVDTYNQYFQYFPKWTGRKVDNRVVSFGCMDLLQPQFYRLWNTTSPWQAPASNTRLMNKAQFGDVATLSTDFGVMPGAYTALTPLFFHPNSGDTNQSNANAQNITDARALATSGFGLFNARTSLLDINLIRAPGASTAGVDVLASPAPFNDYLFKTGYEKIAPNAASDFAAAPQPRGSCILSWTPPTAATDGDLPAGYVVYKSKTSPVKEYWANQVNKSLIPGSANWYHAPVGESGDYYFRIIAVDDYNNRSSAVEIGPVTLAGSTPVPPEIIVDNPPAATGPRIVGAWTLANSAADKFGPNYLFRSITATPANSVSFPTTIDTAGTYAVSEWHSQGTNRTVAARHTVTHSAGTALHTVNQQANGGKWNSIANFSLNAGSNSVLIDSQGVTGFVVMADAIKWSFVPPPNPTPAAPTNLVATAVSTSQIDLTWADNATGETGYEIERTIQGGTTIIITGLPADSTSYSDTSLASDTQYTYVVRAYTGGAQSADSNIVAVRTLIEIPPDVIVDNTAAVFVGTWSTGTASTDFGANYRFVSKGSGLRHATFTANLARNAVYDVYEWHVAGSNRAVDAPHIISNSGGSSTVTVNQTLNGGKWNKIGTFLMNAGTNTIRLTDQFLVGTVMMADAMKWVYVSEPPTTPAAPSGLVATVISDTEISLAWNDNAINELSYEVERTKQGETPQIVAALAADSISFADSGLQALTEYTYVVRAVNGVGKSGPSNSVTAQTLSSTPPDRIVDNPEAQFTLAWTVGSFSADKFGINYAFRSKGTGIGKATYNVLARDTGVYDVYEWHPQGTNRPTDARHTITHRLGNSTVAVNQQVNGGMWNLIGRYGFDGATNCVVVIDDLFTQLPTNNGVVMADAIKLVYVGELPPPPAAPTGLAAAASGQAQVNLTWQDNADNETGYEIVRNGVVVATTAADAASYSDTGLSECIQYTYVVRAINLGGTSADSNSVSITLDSTDPQITAPADVAVNNDSGQCSASGVALGTPQVSDNCGVAGTSNDAPAVYPVGETTVTWTVTDNHGNTAVATQKVTVTDSENPTIIAPDAVTVGTDAGACSASGVALGEAATGDNCGVASVSNDAPSTFDKGVTVVTWTVIDIHGNSATATQSVTVEDREAPQITCPADISIGCNINRLVAVTWDAPVATDNCPGVTVECSPESGSEFPVGQTTVTCTATDAAGNQSSCTFTVTREALGFSGFFPPVGGSVESGDGGSFAAPVRAFKLGSTIPIKMALSCDGSPISTGIHTLRLTKYDDEANAGDPIDATPTDAATTGNQFRLTDASSGAWHYNLNTGAGVSTGTWLVEATMSDGSTRSVWIAVK